MMKELSLDLWQELEISSEWADQFLGPPTLLFFPQVNVIEA
jgi:hypothetical protein